MSKRRRASELIYGSKRALKYPAKVQAVLTGTGTCTRGGVVTVVASNVSTTAYITVATGTNIGTLIGTAAHIPTYNT